MIEIIKKYLTDNNYDGLVSADNECGCSIRDLFACGLDIYAIDECKPAHRASCNDDCDLSDDLGVECEYHMVPGPRPINQPVTTLKSIAKEINVINQANGFDRPTYGTIPMKMMFVVSEIKEAIEAVYGEGDDPIEVELADIAIRILSILDAVFSDEWVDRTNSCIAIGNVYERGEVLLWPVIKELVNALEAWRYNKQKDVCISLELALKRTWKIANMLGWDLRQCILEKMEKNRRRGYLHGKERADG